MAVTRECQMSERCFVKFEGSPPVLSDFDEWFPIIQTII